MIKIKAIEEKTGVRVCDELGNLNIENRVILKPQKEVEQKTFGTHFDGEFFYYAESVDDEDFFKLIRSK